MTAVDWRAVLANFLARNENEEWSYPSGDNLEPFLEVLREVDADREAKYAEMRKELRKTTEEEVRAMVIRMKPIWDAKRAQFGRPPVDIEQEITRIMSL